ncbi:hypothetical protein ACH4UM_21460 [Streptomyces sp. NPDC020801]|uniref:hypothetical protein n=1 Tax=unclassified Streptomyces TaxID=2593676 RepID=UPI003791EAB8
MTTDDTHRLVSREYEGGTRIIAVVSRDEENDQMSDEHIIAAPNEWKANRRHLRAVDDE